MAVGAVDQTPPLPESAAELDRQRHPDTLVPAFEAIRAYVAANSPTMTRDESILEELTKLLHAKIYDEVRSDQGDAIAFYALASETPDAVAQRLSRLHQEASRGSTNGAAELQLDPASCVF